MSNHSQNPPMDDDQETEAKIVVPLPHELTAEWTVNAQLKLSRAGETVKKEFSANDTVKPTCVLYKWNTTHDNETSNRPLGEEPKKSAKESVIQKEESFRSTASSITCGDVGGADSAFSSSNNSNKQQEGTLTAEIKNLETNFYGTRCRSTCNIIVTAVADFLSPSGIQTLDSATIENQENDSKSFLLNTTACYTVQPEKSSCPQRGKQLNSRDAICQTSDIETKHLSQQRKQSPLKRRDSRRSYDYRKTTADDLLQKLDYRNRVHEDNSFMPSQTASTIQTSQSSSPPYVSSRVGRSTEANLAESGFPTFATSDKPIYSDAQKKPRTVHIDVYCTGSEDDDQADAEFSSESDEHNKRLEQDSNSTFQTVLENEQMRLRHQRKRGSSLPRRLVDNNAVTSQNQNADDSQNISIGHALTKSSTAEEVQESKQLLFRKHVGDQRAIKLQNLRQKYLRQSSDDNLSFGYPNSSRSTVRDNTCSSVSSLLAGQDLAETSSKETGEVEDLSYSLTKSDSFEYENALDRLRIRQMERLWSRHHSSEDELKLQGSNKIQPGSSNLKSILESTSSERKSPNHQYKLDVVSETDSSSFYSNEKHINTEPVPLTYDKTDYNLQQTSHFARNKPGFLQFFGPHLEHSQHIDEAHFSQQSQSLPVIQNDSTLLFPNYEAGLQRWKSEKHDNLSASVTPLLTPTNLSRQPSPQPPLPDKNLPYNKNVQRNGSETPTYTITDITPITAIPTPARHFDMYNRSSPVISETSPQPPPVGYSLEYLDKAKIFGKVVSARKPGHHVGPTKNPSCSCESCQRWLAERFQIRGRVFALNEMPILKRPS